MENKTTATEVLEMQAEISSLSVSLAAAQEREWVLREALEFYSDINNYKATVRVARGDGSYDYDVPVLIDNGEVACAALERKEG